MADLEVVQVSGFSKTEKRTLAEKIKQLGCTYYSQVEFHKDCDLLVIERPCRSEKYLCALATGVPIVRANYINDSYEAQGWKNLSTYIWRSKPADFEGPEEIYTAPYRIYSTKRCRRIKAFSSWTCAIKVRNANNHAVYKRILGIGGARLIDITFEGISTSRNIPIGLTHLFTENSFKGKRLGIMASNGIHCVIADYIGDFLIKEEKPQPYHYIMPYSNVIDLTNSPVMILDNSKTDTDSDVEIISATSPKRSACINNYVPHRTSPLATHSQPPHRVNNNVCKRIDFKSETPANYHPMSNGIIRPNTSAKLETARAKPTTNSSRSDVIPKESTSISCTPQPSLTDVFLTHSNSFHATQDSNKPSTSNSATNNLQLLTQSQRTPSKSSTQGALSIPIRGYSKLLVLTPPKITSSQAFLSNTGCTPPKRARTELVEVKTEIKTERSEPRVNANSSFTQSTPRKSKKPPVMPPGSLRKHLTIKSQTEKVVSSPSTAKGKQDISGQTSFIDVQPLEECKLHEAVPMSLTEDTNHHDGTASERQFESRSCLGLIDHLTSRLSNTEREQLYRKHKKMKAINKLPGKETVDLTDSFQSKDLQKIPVLLGKQILACFENDDRHGNLNGFELLNLCTSNVHYPPPRLLKQLYQILLTTTNPITAYNVYEYLANRLMVNPPNKKLHEDPTSSPNKLLRTRRMRHIYMLSLADKDYFKRTYLSNLGTAVKTLINGGIPLDTDPPTPRLEVTDEDEDDTEPEEEEKMEVDSKDVNSSSDRDSCLGSRLFINFTQNLLVTDFCAAMSPKDSMLYDICKGNSFHVNLVDSKDTSLLLDSVDQLIDKQEMDAAYKVLKLVGLVGELCRPSDHTHIDHSLSTIISRVSSVIKVCDLTETEDILVGFLPSWFSYQIILYLLEDQCAYSNQIICPTAETFHRPSLRALISNYFFLIPSESRITNRKMAIKIKSDPSIQQSTSTNNKRNHKGETPLHRACMRGDVQKVRQLLMDVETNVNTTDNAGWTPLHEACNRNHQEIVEILLTHKSSHFHFDGGGEVDMLATAGDQSFTPLHDAVNVGAIGVIKLLLKYGGRKLIMARSKLGTVLDITANEEILQLLKDVLNAPDTTAGNENNSSNGPEMNIHTAPPRSEIYHTHNCATAKDVIERYVTYCCQLLSFHLNSFSLDSTDEQILNGLSSHLQPFVDHIRWLSSCNGEESLAILKERLRGLLLLSL